MTESVRLDLPREHGPEVLALFNAHLDLVGAVAGRMSRDLGPFVKYEDLAAAGREGLFFAARRYDPTREVPFRAYANYRVRGAILDAIRKTSRLPRRAYARLASLEAADLVSEGEASFVFNARSPELSDAEAENCLDEHLASVATAASAAAQAAFAAPSEKDDANQANPEETYARAELLSLVRRTLSDLDAIEGKIIELMYFEGMNLEQVSITLGMGKPWACRLHARAMDHLTKRLRRVA